MSHPFEHQILRGLKSVGARPGRWLVAGSGGLDSVVMLHVLAKWRRYLNVKLTLAHVHHGLEGDRAYRDQAQELTREMARHYRVNFVTNRPQNLNLKSEADWRDYRHRCLNQWRRETGGAQVVLGHHRDDLTETQLLRLIRGTGPAGLRAMSLRDGVILRPLLNSSRAEIKAFADEQNLTWIEDPSNQETRALRNWVRHDWLPALEARQRGATKSLARSLAQLVGEHGADGSPAPEFLAHVGLRRKALAELPLASQREIVAHYLHALGLKDFGQTHVIEICKRLSTTRKTFGFTLRQCCFHVTPDLVWASRV